MDNVQRIYRRSETNLIPRRPCPDCKTPIRGRWRELVDFSDGIDPDGSVEWRCFGETCLTGRDGF